MSYTLITGASAGIGAEFARQLAAEKRNLILTARRTERLEALAAELGKLHSIDCQVISADLAQEDGASQLVAEIRHRQLPLSGLVNNAGFGDSGEFLRLPLSRHLAMLQVNLSALTELCHSLVPELLEQPGSFLINVGSISSHSPAPGLSSYGASKAYILSLTEGLAQELRHQQLTISCLCPGATVSEFAELAHLDDSQLFARGVMSTESVVRYGLKNRHRVVVIPGIHNKLLIIAAKLLPKGLRRYIASLFQKKHKTVSDAPISSQPATKAEVE